MKKKAICILSGGMDSSLCAYIAKDNNYDIITVHFNYAQLTEAKELQSFRAISQAVGAIDTYEIDIDFFKKIGASALTDSSIDVPVNGIEKGVPVTYVPFRNGIFLSIASAIAEKENAEAIYIGVVEEDSSGYPDCRDNFISSMQQSINLGVKDETNIKLVTPLISLSKKQIVQTALKYKVPLELTWSCYKNSNIACGLCDSCRLRLNGFKEAGISDKIKYKN